MRLIKTEYKVKLKILFTYSIFIIIIIGCGGGGSYTETKVVSSGPVTIETFMTPLSADGEWIKITKEEIDANGVVETESSVFIDDDINTEYIWRPNRAFIYEGWNPYTNGSWVWTDDGWMWASSYDWGWAPYHYGRWWWSPVYGWVWSPGYRWAPAWVTWRWSDYHIGWYPLSPRVMWNGGSVINYNYRNENWTFVEKQNFTKTVNNTTIVNAGKNPDIVSGSKQYVNLKEQNNKIVNQGPNVNDIQNSTGTKIKPKSINESSVKGKPQVGKNSVSVYKGGTKTVTKNKNKGNNPGRNKVGKNGKDDK